MATGTKAEQRRDRAIRLAMLAVVWLAGLAAGLCALLAATARYGCARNDPGLACDVSGSVLGIVLVITVVALVTLVTMLSLGRPVGRARVVCGAGVAALALCFVAARSLLGTA